MTAANGGSVVVTGASTGIGRACALELDRLGFRVFAGVRKPEAGEALRRDASGLLEALSIEITDSHSLATAARVVEDAVGERGLQGLVNNAGIAMFGPLEFLPLDVLRRQLEVNVTGQLAAIQAFLPLLRRGRGRIVQMGSISGVVAPPFLGPYSAGKFAVEALCDALRLELRADDIPVSIVEAGRIATPIWRKTLEAFDAVRAGLPAEAEERYGAVFGVLRGSAVRPGGEPPEAVARVVTHALTARRPRARYPVGADARARLRLRWLPTSLRDWLLTRRLPAGGGKGV